MAKTAIKKVQSKVQPAVKNVKAIDEYIGKYFWLIIPVLTLIYFISSRYSQGFYQDDEIAQYLNMIQFWNEPSVILGNNPKPGYKIFMVVPALFGYDVVLFINSLIASLTVYFTYRMLKVYEVNYAYFGAMLLATQPLFFDLSFRSYSEIFTALVIVIFLILYKKEYYLIAALVCGYIFTIRQEISIFGLILAIIFFKEKKWKEIIAIAIFPVFYNLLGYLKTGDILYVWTEMKTVAGLKYETQPIYHYFKVYIFIVGPISLVLFLQGFFGLFADNSRIKEYLKKYLLFYLLFVTIFFVQIYTMLNNGPNPGNWRYLLHISPICVFFATVGLNNLTDEKFKKFNYIVTGVLIFLTFAFLSKTTDGFKLLENSDYKKVFFLIAFLIVTLIVSKKISNDYLNKVSVLLIILSIIYLALDFTPKKLSSENLTVKTATEFLNSQNFNDRNIYTNHALLMFYSDAYKKEPSKFNSINLKNISEAPIGSVIAWETHYGYRPEWKSDTKLEDLLNNQNFKLINQFTSSDKRFIIYFFEKIN